MAAQANEALLPFSMADKDKDTDKDNKEEKEVNEEEKVTNLLPTTVNTAYIHHPISGSTTVEEEVDGPNSEYGPNPGYTFNEDFNFGRTQGN
jgi:hypothetical protein